jgi:hypothetical protein
LTRWRWRIPSCAAQEAGVVELVLVELHKNPPKAARRPVFPNHYKAGLEEPAEGK